VCVGMCGTGIGVVSKESQLKRLPYESGILSAIHFSNGQLDSTVQLLLFEFLKQESPLKQQ
jgi:hypothetical protein